MSTIKEYEAIYETFNKYAKEFQENPKTTKQIDPKFVKTEKENLKKSIEEKEKKVYLNSKIPIRVIHYMI